MKYHYSRKEGWLGNPCGLVYFKGRYHLFFQLNPDSLRYGRMHWGHAVSDDLINWEELPLAISPDMPYENGSGCMSGSVIEKDGKLYGRGVEDNQQGLVSAAFAALYYIKKHPIIYKPKYKIMSDQSIRNIVSG